MVKRWLMALMALAVSIPALAALTAEVDRTQLYDDESLVLTIRADFPEAQEPLDLTALTQLFDIEHQRQSTQSRYSTSGGQQRWREWTLVLRPRHTGTLAIPNFELGGEQTQPIMVTVRDSADRQDGLPEDAVELNVYLKDSELYVGQSTTLTIDLDYQLRLQGNFERLSLDEFETELIDESNTTETRDGRQVRRYRLVYQLTAKQSGVLRIPEIRFSGQYQSGQFDSTRRLTRRHPVMNINVKPVPEEFPANAYWLPARSLTLSDNLPQQLSLIANEHLDWSITTQAAGLSATQLPDPLAGFDSDDFRLYRNAPEFEDGSRLSQRRDLNALVFTEAGTYQLPAVRVPWWNLETDQLEYAELPARSVEVKADPKASFSPPATPTNATDPVVDPQPETSNLWLWVALSLGMGWAATVLVWVASSLRKPAAVTAPVEAEKPEPDDDLKNLARDARPADFYSALGRWLNREYGLTLGQLTDRLAPEHQQTLNQLAASLFSRQPTEPPTTESKLSLVKALKKALSGQRKRPEKDLTKVYPKL